MRRFLSDLMIFSGLLAILLVGTIWFRSVFGTGQPVERQMLVSSMGIAPPLPDSTSVPESASAQPTGQPPALETPGPTGPIIRLMIPRIAVDQSVVPVGLAKNSKGKNDWDTDSLFATDTRRDLVGQLATSLNPGEGGNIILVGHNYDWGRPNWEGVFLHLDDVEPGNQIVVYTQNGESFAYIVQSVQKIPSNQPAQNERFMWPTESEQLTLVTCGGPSFGHWTARIYVVAIPLN